MDPVHLGLDEAAERLECFALAVPRDVDRVAQHDRAAAEGQPEAGPVPRTEAQVPARHHGRRDDRPAGEAREGENPGIAPAGNLRHVGAEGHGFAGLQRPQHRPQALRAALGALIGGAAAAAGAGGAHHADAEALQRDGVDVPVRVPRDDRRHAVARPAQKRHHDVLAVPHAEDQRRARVDPPVGRARGRLARVDLEAVGEAHEPQIGRRETAEEALHGGLAEETLTEAHVTLGAGRRAAARSGPDRIRPRMV